MKSTFFLVSLPWKKNRKLRSSSESTLSHSKIIIRRETMNTGIKVDGVTVLVKKTHAKYFKWPIKNKSIIKWENS